jgi:hypothetical protein
MPHSIVNLYNDPLNFTDSNFTDQFPQNDLEIDPLLYVLGLESLPFNGERQQASAPVITEVQEIVDYPPTTDSNLTEQFPQNDQEFVPPKLNLEINSDFDNLLDNLENLEFYWEHQQVSASVITDVSPITDTSVSYTTPDSEKRNQQPLLCENIQRIASIEGITTYLDVASVEEITTYLDAEEKSYGNRTKEQSKNTASQIIGAKYGTFFQNATRPKKRSAGETDITDIYEEQPTKRPPSQLKTEQEEVKTEQGLALDVLAFKTRI